MARINATKVDDILNAAKSKLAAGREKGDMADLAGTSWEVTGSEIVTPIDGRPYGVITVKGADGVYFTSTKITKIVKAVRKLSETTPLTVEDGVIKDTYMIAVGGAEEFEAPDGKTVTYYPVEIVDYAD